MNCVAIGDMFLPAKYFDKALEKSGLFGAYCSISWKEDEDRKEARNTVRRIESLGYNAFPPPPELLEAVKTAEVLFLHLCPVSKEVIQAAPHLKYIVTARGGTENIDVRAAEKQGITIINCPAHNAVAVAEYTIGLMICEMRNIVRSSSSLMQGVWAEQYPNSSKIPELSGATVGIVGFGTIGRLVAERLLRFKANILVFDPYVPREAVQSAGCHPVTMDKLLKESDIVTLHGRIGVGEPPIISGGELKQMKRTAYLINTARAMLVDMEALEEALRTHEIMGAAIDVFPSEPLPKDYDLLKLDCVTLTNHRGGDTLNSYIKAPELLVEQLKEKLRENAG